jgi:hypothetical protein
MLTRPVMSADAPTGGVEEGAGDQLNLPQGAGWEDWQVVRNQSEHRATVKVLVRKGQAPATAKVRIVVAQTPASGGDRCSPSHRRSAMSKGHLKYGQQNRRGYNF